MKFDGKTTYSCAAIEMTAKGTRKPHHEFSNGLLDKTDQKWVDSDALDGVLTNMANSSRWDEIRILA